MKRLSTVLIASLLLARVSGAAMAQNPDNRDRTEKTVTVTKTVKTNGASKQNKSVQQVQKKSTKNQRKNFGHRFDKKEVVVMNNWKERGLPKPGNGKVYARNGDALYLVAATSLIVQALIN
jgi:Ni/Co efflux regulator RcnB